MMDLFGNESEFKPLVRFFKIIPGYYVSKAGNIYNSVTNRILNPFSNYEYRKDGSQRLKEVAVRLSIPKKFFNDYEYRTRKDVKNSTRDRIYLPIHRAVIESWKSIDECPPDRLKEEWNQIITSEMVGQSRIPESYKQWVRDTAIVDHIDDNPANNSVNNLQWVVPKDNNSYRKGAKLND